jgi:hypothetical protein
VNEKNMVNAAPEQRVSPHKQTGELDFYSTPYDRAGSHVLSTTTTTTKTGADAAGAVAALKVSARSRRDALEQRQVQIATDALVARRRRLLTAQQKEQAWRMTSAQYRVDRRDIEIGDASSSSSSLSRSSSSSSAALTSTTTIHDFGGRAFDHLDTGKSNHARFDQSLLPLPLP